MHSRSRYAALVKRRLIHLWVLLFVGLLPISAFSVQPTGYQFLYYQSFIPPEQRPTLEDACSALKSFYAQYGVTTDPSCTEFLVPSGKGGFWGLKVYAADGSSSTNTNFIMTGAFCPANSTADYALWGAVCGACGPAPSCSCNPGYGEDPTGTRCAAVVDRNPPDSPPCNCAADPAEGNPIYPLRGVKREVVETGLRIGSLNLQLTYDTTPRAPISGVRAASANPGALGSLWSSAVHRRVVVQANALGAMVWRGDGHTAGFVGTGNGIFVAANDNRDRLQSIPGGYLYFDAAEQSQETYDSQGKLTAIGWARGDSIALHYSDANTPGSVAPGIGYLLQVQDNKGRSLAFKYDINGHLVEIGDPAGQVIALTYDPQFNLKAITWPDGKTRTYLYENSNFGWAMTGVKDERGLRKSTFSYDTAGRVVSTEYAGGVNKFTASYTTPPTST
ncbi:MAG: hypothetical protein ABI605_10435 [Rhizobacter sp.]